MVLGDPSLCCSVCTGVRQGRLERERESMPEARSPIEVLSKDNGLGPVSLLRDAIDLDTSRCVPQPLARVGNTRDPLMVMRRASGKRTTPYDLPLMGTGQGVGLLRSPAFQWLPYAAGPVRGGWGSL